MDIDFVSTKYYTIQKYEDSMNFAIITAHTPDYQPLADLTWNQNKVPYCERYGYDAIAKTDNFKYDPSNIGFDRTELMIELLESGKYDWVYAVGCDTMITNFNKKLEDLVDNDYHFIIAVDCNNINNDSYMARATPECIAWLKHIVSLQPKYGTHHWREQQAMIDNIDGIEQYMKIVPQRYFNSYNNDLYPHQSRFDLLGNDGTWQPGDFLIHWPARGVHERIQLAQEMLPKVIK
jgi:hypothetical protein